jgi:hypothetical protein
MARNRDRTTGGKKREQKTRSGGIKAPAAAVNRDRRLRAFATLLKRRLSFGRRKREPLTV